jgi:crossover junction endodeoxyribonuclease RuvC
MAVIGIDPGTAITGYGIVEESPSGELITISYGVIRTSSGIEPHERLLSLSKQLNHVLKTYSPESGAVEKLFFQRNVRTALSVGQARGVILLSLAMSRIPVFEYNPMEVKLSVTGYGKADKKQVQQMVKTMLDLDEIPAPDDAADALAVAICHIHSRRFRNLEKKYA